jgi:hypothetical protein
MRKTLYLALIGLIPQLTSAQTVIVDDNFTDRSKLKDNTLLLNWGTYSSPQTGFAIQMKTDASTPVPVSYNSISLTDSALKYAGYVAGNSLKTLTSIDYAFGTTLNRATGPIRIEFDGIWNTQDNGGENGRLVVTLMGDYPAGGGQFNAVNDTTLPDPFGKPLYNIRIRNTNTSNGPLMLYGAGLSTNPRWEIYNTAPGWWLPGFSVQSGGGSPGSGPDYPASGTKKSSMVVTSTTIWRHYTWLISTERMELFVRNSNQPASADVRIFFMQTPSTTIPAQQLSEINAAHGTSVAQLPPFYRYYDQFNAVRFYFRGGSNSHLANVKVTQIGAVLAFGSINLQQPVWEQEKALLKGEVLPAQNTAQHLVLTYSDNGTDFQPVRQWTIPAGETRFSLTHLPRQSETGMHYYRVQQVGNNNRTPYSNIVNLQQKPVQTIRWRSTGDRTVVLDLPASAIGRWMTVSDESGRIVLRQQLRTTATTITYTRKAMLVCSITGFLPVKIVL